MSTSLEQLRQALDQAKRNRNSFIRDFNARGQVLFDVATTDTQAAIQVDMDNSPENYARRLAELDGAVSSAQRLLDEHLAELPIHAPAPEQIALL